MRTLCLKSMFLLWLLYHMLINLLFCSCCFWYRYTFCSSCIFTTRLEIPFSIRTILTIGLQTIKAKKLTLFQTLQRWQGTPATAERSDSGNSGDGKGLRRRQGEEATAGGGGDGRGRRLRRLLAGECRVVKYELLGF
ncbi:hypothetical protein QVD17_35216 [Tagetes erecta]|uniref:Uncharacterized protein n=1 Tax=Tagetes erecta TaxID=13708 RepID=A0AAD8K0H0_TARER|nr:hypothetical protein QVD17_35216 [Tagetes erecta]